MIETGFKAKCRPVIFTGAFLLLFFVWSPFATAFVTPPPLNSDTNFPIYPSIRPNIDFWIRIFTEVPQSQGLLHDTNDLSIIYDTLPIDDSRTLSARKKNKKIIKKAVKTYKHILLSLASGKPPETEAQKRVAAIFGATPSRAVLEKAARNIRVQTGLKEEFKGGLIRSGAFMDEFKRIFRSHGLPEDLAYLPHVESSFRYKAYSKFGAAGIWQFTRSTGRLYMRIDYVVDERRDPFISTHAAARLLKKNKNMLGEWPLAITAYNHGLNGMLRAKNKNGSYENVYNSYRSASFRFASKNFYSEFLAAKFVAKNYRTYFGELVFDTPRPFTVLTTKGYVPAERFAGQFGLSLDDLKQMNPALRPPVFNGQKHIPKGFKLRLPGHLILTPKDDMLLALYQPKQKPSRFHRVEKGDTAGAIARLHSVSLDDLVLANGLNRRATIYAGQNLRIPVHGERLAGAQPEASPDAGAEPRPAPVIEPAPEPAPELVPAQMPPELPREVIAVSKPSEPPAQGVDIPLNPDIYSGNLSVFDIRQKNDQTTGAIFVEAEETLGHYADWLGIKTSRIRKLNHFRYGIPITIGQVVRLPLDKKTAARFEEQRFEYHKEIEEDFFDSYSIQEVAFYEIKKGDNIWTLCLNELEVPFWLLKKLNPETNFQNLIPSQKIKYPQLTPKNLE